MNLSAKESQFIHNNCHVTDDYNYKIEAPKSVLRNRVSQQEVQVLTRTPADNAEIAKLGKELIALNPNNPVIISARKACQTYQSVFHIKQALNKAIQIENSSRILFSALAKINS
tara:strand:+ start:160 stop:501 length:342 start_codon:yes stop_codon:yes gene_type:complete